MTLCGLMRLVPVLAFFLPDATAVSVVHRTKQLVLSESQSSDAPTRLRSWEEARSMAAAAFKKMSQAERFALLRGTHFRVTVSPMPGWYVGNIEGVPRLGIPPLKMQDAGQGFRTTEEGTEGTTTAWPSMLALASTWDEALVEQVAAAIGQEFKGKGANVVLGPSVNVHRSALGGRNFEYLSGEDPYLGARLTQAYVHGVQNQGVMAVAKHFAFNEQETSRMAESSIVDGRTSWELYYPPFQAAVDAGVGSFMCSYNRVNGTWSCQNPELLKKALKGTMDFKGFVMSDWAATHTPEALKFGLDQEQPGVIYTLMGPIGLETLSNIALAITGGGVVEEAATRVLTSIYHLGLDKDAGCAPPNCGAELRSNQKTAEHLELARKAAEAAVVLLWNKADFLPLSNKTVRTLAIVGEASAADIGEKSMFYAGGGSGSVLAGPTFETPLDAIRKRAEVEGIKVLVPADGSAEAAEAVAKAADAVIVVGGARSSEGVDRKSLSLDDGADGLIAVVSTWKPTVVLLEVTGAVLTPWSSRVYAIATLMLGGEKTGAAWASVLFGDVNPSGKLPVMFPKSDKDTIWPNEQLDVKYTEGMLTSYRSPVFEAAFPFGHGLSYTSFTYGDVSVVDPKDCTPASAAAPYLACVSLNVTNRGKVAGAEVAQAYLHFPDQHVKGSELDATSPDMVLKGFVKTRSLAPAEAQQVIFGFTARDLSRYDSSTGGWLLEKKAEVRIGASSEDLRQVVQIGPFSYGTA